MIATAFISSLVVLAAFVICAVVAARTMVVLDARRAKLDTKEADLSRREELLAQNFDRWINERYDMAQQVDSARAELSSLKMLSDAQRQRLGKMQLQLNTACQRVRELERQQAVAP